MDWVPLAFVAFFIILPLVQELLRAMKKNDEEVEIAEQPDQPGHTPPIVIPGGATKEPPRREAAPELPPPLATRDAKTPAADVGSIRRSAGEAEGIRKYSSASAARESLEAAKSSSEKLIAREIHARELRPREEDPAARRLKAAAARKRPPTVSRVLPGASNSKAVKGKVRQQAAIRRSLNSKEGLRTGIVLLEVLGPPIALREEPGRLS